MRTSIVFICLLFSSELLADKLYFAFNGLSYHFDRSKNYNETNLGPGLEYDFEQSGNWVPFIAGGTFRDSNNQDSNYLAGGGKYRIPLSSDWGGLYVDIGLTGVLMTRYDYKNNKPFPVAGPFVSVGNDYVALNAAFIPEFLPKSTSLLYFQIMVTVIEF
ncbi:MAG: hypothetical protein GXP11_07890 [Gammaproteobacteria bacterium]|nr:hypothetical protein [Gammaproteobacteria bacterium]